MKKYIGYVYIVLSALIFSTMEIVLKTSGAVFAPIQITALRFFIGGMLLLPLAYRSVKQKGITLQMKDIPFFCLTGCLNVVLAMVFYQLAVTHTMASAVAVLFSSNSIIVMPVAALVLHEKIKKNHIIALFIVIVAIVVIINPFNIRLDMSGVSFALIAAVMFSLYSTVCKMRTSKFGGIAVTSFSFVLGSLILFGIVLIGRIPAVADFLNANGLSIFANVPLFKGIPASAIPALLYVGAVVSAGGFVFHMLAVEKTSARQGGLVFFLKPMIAPILAYIFLKDDITPNMIIGIILFLIGLGVSIIPDILAEKKK